MTRSFAGIPVAVLALLDVTRRSLTGLKEELKD